MKKLLIILFVLLLGLTTITFGQEAEEEYNNLILMPTNLGIWGLGLDIGYQLKIFGLTDTQFIIPFNIQSYEQGYFINSDNSQYTYSGSGDNLALFKRFDIQWGFGIEQGILYNDDVEFKRNILELSLYYKGMYSSAKDNNQSLIFDSGLINAEKGIYHKFEVGITYDNTVYDNIYFTTTGFITSLTYEYAPSFINEFANFHKIDFLNQFNFPVIKTNNFIATIADKSSFTYITGSNIPYQEHPTLGYSQDFNLRGFSDTSYHSNMVFYNNFEIRTTFFNVIDPMINPGFVLFYDIGLYDNKTSKINMIHSTGAGLTLTLDLYLLQVSFGSYFVYDLTNNDYGFEFRILYGYQF